MNHFSRFTPSSQQSPPSSRGYPGAGSAAASASHDPAERLLGLDVLIVEDEAMLALDVTLTMEDAGATVVGPAYSLAQAMALVEAAEFHADVAVLDVNLAGEDVFPVARVLAAKGVPLLFHTGHGSRQQITAMFPEARVCMKPTLSEELVRGVETLIRR